MFRFGKMSDTGVRQEFVESFGGLCHRERNADGTGTTRKNGALQFYDEKNLSARDFPALSTREKRETISTEFDDYSGQTDYPGIPKGGIIAKDKLFWLYAYSQVMDGTKTKLGITDGNVRSKLEAVGINNDGEKQLISMGAYILVWPDKVWINTATESGTEPESGAIEQSNTATGVSVALCRQSGDLYTGVTVSPTAPASPSDKALWMDTSGDVPILKEWSATQEIWVDIPTTYLKISGSGIGTGFSDGDGVFVSGLSDPAYNGDYVLRSVGPDYLVVTGIITAAMSGETVTAARTVPDMDFVLESNNRIWGCKYGVVNGQLVNEIYASKLGDFKNWNVFDGLSTDSYAASRGSDGDWTGAIEYGGMPIFFKEEYIEKVYPSASGAHRIVTTRARGVQKGSHRSLAIVNEALFYKATDGVMVYDGSFPALISEDLGETTLYEAAGGGTGGIYYCSMRDAQNRWRLYTYDIGKGIWHTEDDTHAETFVMLGGRVYFVESGTTNSGGLFSLAHNVKCNKGGTETVDWMAETGAIGYHDSNQKYLSRFLLRMKTEGSVKLYIRYDEGEWLHRDTVYMGGSTKTITMPVPPRRCDHVYLRLVGDADMKLYGMTRYYERGSDVAW